MYNNSFGLANGGMGATRIYFNKIPRKQIVVPISQNK